jgi:hypothetical protein
MAWRLPKIPNRNGFGGLLEQLLIAVFRATFHPPQRRTVESGHGENRITQCMQALAVPPASSNILNNESVGNPE